MNHLPISSAGINPPTDAAPADARPSPALSPPAEMSGDFSTWHQIGDVVLPLIEKLTQEKK